MKKTILLFLVLLTLILSACSGQAPAASNSTQQSTSVAESAQSSSPSASSDTQGTVELGASYEEAAPVEMQLLLGTLKLTGTEQAVTKEQASALVPLWTNLQTLHQSMGPGQPQADNAATQSQVDELVKQIQSLMTFAQIEAIAEMQITQDSAMTIMQELGVAMGGPQGDGNMPPQGTPPAGGPDEDQAGGAGAPPSDGQQPDNLPADGMIPPPLIDALIQALEKIAAGETVTADSTASNNISAANPPSGSPPGGDSGDVTSALSTATGAYTLDGGTDMQSSQTYTASNTDQSGVYVINGGNLTLNSATVNTSGNTSSDGNSSFYGLNAGVLAASGSAITMNGGTISTTGTGANGAFAVSKGSVVNLSDVTIQATGDGGHGVMVTLGGVMNLTNVNMTTSGAHSAPIATDRGGGTINATGGTLNAMGTDSPCYYSTGTLNIENSTCNATGSEAVVIEGANTVRLTNSVVTSSVSNKWGVMIYQSFSGDAQGSDGVFTMMGGSLAYTDVNSPLFYVTNTNGHITLSGVNVMADSGVLIKAAGNDRWGTSGSNGGTVILVADKQILSGNFLADNISSITATLQNGSILTGAIDAANTAKEVNLTLDASSTWSVTADSYLSCLSDPGISGNSITNITGNGHTVYYNTLLCPTLNGQTYTLNGGGTLTPLK